MTKEQKELILRVLRKHRTDCIELKHSFKARYGNVPAVTTLSDEIAQTEDTIFSVQETL